LKALEEQKKQMQSVHGEALHAYCKEMIAASPASLEEAIETLRAQDYMFRQNYRPDKTPMENYEDRPILYITVDNFLTKHHPGHFQPLLAAQHAELAALDEQIAALRQAV
jgi:hypothetical protein